MTINAHVDDLAAQLARTSLTPKQRDDPSSPDDTTRTTFVAPELAQSSPPLLTRNSSVTDVARYLKQVRPQRIAFLVGAGISVAAGIPDFRTPGVGLYDTLGAFALPYPEAIFDVEYFRRRPEPFFALARAMWPDPTHPVHFPTVIHHMMRIVHDEGTLFRVYTQNIDGLEELAGIPSHKLFQAHGTYRSARCIDCSAVQDVKAIRKVVQEGGIPRCQDCVTSKTLGGVDADGLPAGREGGAGLVKPDIVFFGEDLPSSFVHHAEDIKRADFAFIIGTSLNVQPFATLPDLLPSTVPRVLINREVVGCFSRRTSDRLKKSPGSRTDVLLTGGDCQEIAEQLIEAMGWTAQLRQLQERNIEHKGENEMMR